MQPVNTFGQRLSVDRDRIAESDAGVLIGAGTPYLSVSLNAAEDFSAAD
jgi:hypothetical protein